MAKAQVMIQVMMKTTTWSGKIMVKFIGTQTKGKLPRQLWVPKALVSHMKGTKLSWVPKQKA